MDRGARPAGSLRAWGLALVFVLVIDAAITRTGILWGKTSYEDTLDLKLVQLTQTYQAERAIYAPAREAPIRVTVLGDSSIWFPAHAPYVERELRRIAPGLDVRVDNLGVFGALVGDLETMTRNLGQVRPSLVVLALDGAQLLPGAGGRIGNWPARLMNVGCRECAVPPEDETSRADRWMRTAWRLYRFREFARAAIEDRIFPGPPSGRPLPDELPSLNDFFTYMYGARAPEVAAAYASWRHDGSLPAFVEYLRVARAGALMRVGTPELERAPLESDGVGPQVLDCLLARLTRAQWPALILLMPANPLLEQDRAGEYHKPGFSDEAAGVIRRAAERRHIPVVDGRRWMPAEAFFDLVHLFPDLSGFQKPFARTIVDALGA